MQITKDYLDKSLSFMDFIVVGRDIVQEGIQMRALSSNKEFSEFVFELLLYKGFKIDSYFDDIGADGGRDIEAHTFETDSAEDELEIVKWWIELKYREKSAIGARNLDDLFSKLARASEKDVQKFLIITNSYYTPTAKDEIKIKAKKYKIVVKFWDKTSLSEIENNYNLNKSKLSNIPNKVQLIDRVADIKTLLSIV